MAGTPASDGFWATATLRRSRAMVRSGEGRRLAITAGGLYLFAALLVGKMLVFGPTDQPGIQTIYLGWGIPWWNFPQLIVIAPNAVLALPLFSAAAMGLVAVGIGLGMGVSVRLALQLYRWSRRGAGSPAAFGSITGLTPALLALLTLGACCSTTAATTASIGVIAEATGSSTEQLLANAWFLSVFQIAVLWVSLVAQERLVAVYYALAEPDPGASTETQAPLSVHRPGLVALGIRAWIASAALLWLLAIVADWTVVDPTAAGPAAWAGWLLLHAAPSGGLLLLALFPDQAYRWADRLARRGFSSVARGGTFALALLLLVGVPPPLAQPAFHGLGNELLAALGVGGSLGGIPAPAGSPLVLGLRWGLVVLPVGITLLGLAIWPHRWLVSSPKGGPRADPAEPASHLTPGAPMGGPTWESATNVGTTGVRSEES